MPVPSCRPWPRSCRCEASPQRTAACGCIAAALPTKRTDRAAARRARALALLCSLALALGSALPASSRAAGSAATAPASGFDIDALPLTEALGRLAEQAGLQLVYEPGAVAGRRSKPVHEVARVEHALDRLLEGSGLGWRYVGAATVVIQPLTAAPEPAGRPREDPDAGRPTLPSPGLAVMPDVDVDAELAGWVPSGSAASGFQRPLLETPRSVSLVDGDTIDLLGMTAVEDLLRVAPGVFTTTRFGVQGSIDIRAVPADSYFRGMKRLTLQGHGRSVLAALDSIEVVAGPPSPLYGPGKIGGYTNVVPRSGRARSGGYLQHREGFVQAIAGSYDRREVSFGAGGPVDRALTGGRAAGYYVYGLAEDSGAFADGVPVKQRLLQLATSIDNFAGPFRLETGFNLQESITAGALIGRLTQGLVDDGRYIGGAPLVDLDLNGNGRIGYLEMNRGSPVAGRLSANNQPLNQLFAWPTDAAGRPLSLSRFPRVPGIPRSVFELLQAHPEADPTGLLRSQGIGGPVPLSGRVPVGMMLDPRTVDTGVLDLHRSAAFERTLHARFATAYLDLVDDADPAGTRRNQLFFDGMDQYKSSNQPFSTVQRVLVVEDKYTASWRPEWRLHGARLDTLWTANLRHTVSLGRQTLADYGNHRGDALDPAWDPSSGLMPGYADFTSANEVATLADDGLPWTSLYHTRLTELGLGGLAEVTLPRSEALLTVGARHDVSAARNVNEAGRFDMNTGTAEAPGAVLAGDDIARGRDGGASWSVSLMQPLTRGLRVYATRARSSLLLDGNNNTLTNAVIRAGHVGTATMSEVGVKGSWLSGRLALSASVFDQGRIGVSADDDPSVINAYATSTRSRGWQAELRWSPTRRDFLGVYAVRRQTRYVPNVGGAIQVDARAVGFVDVVDANGQVVFPAEAFLYGGRARIQLPDGMAEYDTRQGNPETQLGLSAVRYFGAHWGASLRSTFLSATCAGRLCLVRLPSSLVTDAGLFLGTARMQLKLDLFNLTNERYFRARTGDTLGDVIAEAMPDRRCQLTLTLRF